MHNNDPLIGQQIDDFLIEELLGHGGMGRVYRGLDVKLKRYAAIKVMTHPDRKADVYQKRFYKEAQSIAKLEHPNIVTIYRYNDVNNIYYMAMQFIDGADLRWVLQDYFNNGDFMDYPTMLKIMDQISRALDYSHQNGVIHRDIKPSNIMISRDGVAILTDFGLALDVQEGTGGEIFGSPHYIAPEQAVNSAQAVPQTDFYALSVILYEILTGSVPFSVGSALQVAMAHIDETLPDPLTINPDLHPAFVPVLKKALEKTPADRYPDGASLMVALRAAVEEARNYDTQPGISSLGRPVDRIAKNIKPLTDPATKLHTRFAPAPDPAEPPTVIASNEIATRKRGYTVYLVLFSIVLIVLLVIYFQGTDALLNYLPSNISGQSITAKIEGTVANTVISREGATLTIYNQSILIPRSNPLFDALNDENADDGIETVLIEGVYSVTADAWRFDTVRLAEINGLAVNLNVENQ